MTKQLCGHRTVLKVSCDLEDALLGVWMLQELRKTPHHP
jgi:hypothetical protein